MTKQEAIKTAEFRVIYPTEVRPNLEVLPLEEVKNIISQIHEPQKPVVPKFVAEWIDDSREYSFDFDEWLDYENQPLKVYNWLNPENKRQAELNVLALVTLIVNGANAVEVEQEKLYTVEIPNPNSKSYMNVLKRVVDGIIVATLCRPNTSYFKHKEFQLTEYEIKQDFEWAFQFAKEVE